LLPILLLLQLLIGRVNAETLFFHDDFEGELERWDEFRDASISTDELNRSRSTRFALREYRAQYLVHEVRLEERPSWSFIYEFHVNSTISRVKP